MLMGDKIETATCNAVSSRLAERSQGIFKIVRIPNRTDVRRALIRFKNPAGAYVLIVYGTSLQTDLAMLSEEFMYAVAATPRRRKPPLNSLCWKSRESASRGKLRQHDLTRIPVSVSSSR